MKQNVSGFILLLFFLLSSFLCLGQEKEPVVLQGVVVAADSLIPLPDVHIRLKNARLATATAANGRFRVSIYAHDTLVFTRIGYHPFLLTPADSTPESLNDLVITMKEQVYELGEVKVKAYEDITQYIRRPQKPFSMERSKGTPLFEKKEAEERSAVGMGTGMNGASLEGAVTAFANLFNSKFQQEKKLKELLALEAEEERKQYLREMMTEKYQAMVAHVSTLNEAEIERFTLQYMPDPQVMINMNDYAVMVSILESLEQYQPVAKDDLWLDKLLETGVFEGEVKPGQ